MADETTNGTGEPAEAQTQQLTIQGMEFTAPAPYAEGHPLSAAEAVVLNQTFGENLRNNFAKRVKDAKDKAGEGKELDAAAVKSLVDEFAAYAEEYEFAGKRRGGTSKLDPVTREARKIAKGIVLEALKKKDMDVKTLPEGKLEELISLTIEKRPSITEEAQRRIDAAKAVAQEALGDDLLAGVEAVAVPAVPAA